jgi:ABC-type antimicrobial peptide transport system permease subunit
MTSGLGLACVGILLGLGAAVAVTRLLANFLFGVSPTDSATLSAVSIGIFSVAAATSALPALRVTRVDPTISLRYE